MNEITRLLDELKIPENQIICTSHPKHLAPNGREVYNWIRKQFQENDLYVIYVLSENFYKSASCLNEMGAAWLQEVKICPILLPGFTTDRMDGVVFPSEIAVMLDDEEEMLNARLNNLKKDIVNKFSVTCIEDTTWDEAKKTFLSNILTIKDTSEELNGYHLRGKSKLLFEYTALSLSKTFCVLKSDGKVLRIRSGKRWIVNSLDINSADAIEWNRAVEQLLEKSLIRETGTGTNLYHLTEEGIRLAVKEKDSK